MDILGYAALGGLERLTIVAGAVIIGYWGYRLYTAEKRAGLVFMGLAVVVLVGALATGGSYVRSVGEGYQLASLPAVPAEDPAAPPASESPFVENTPSAPLPEAAPDAAAEIAAAPGEPAPADLPLAAPAPVVDTEAVMPPVEAVAEPETAAAAEPQPETSPVRLATGQELGGRIVSVKSENVSLEWSSDSD